MKWPSALTAEQKAYQALLKLNAREFNVTQSRKGEQKGGGSGQPNQKQLEQLDLKQNENRYETQSQAQQPAAEKSEQQQVLNRLKELAQRQQDLTSV